ncbi:MAG: hypothetical protein PHE17_11840 [Thiothrix sp.]|uniref:hypothetical protein n=1 Tax=Thiothrix sp. TaxID=1032 RepID=UPI00262D7CB5|nr:hypothetical protein [Thiothrix sp.]MDD5393700.1 hypothetical protein [Thiothrix sp.]
MTKLEHRIHFGMGCLSFERNTSVFINCPFDSAYSSIFDAIVFSTTCCGFLPRSAIESGSTSVPRMDRITQAIYASKYSIHDLSRCRGEGDKNLARFNMPLELGVCMAQKFGQESGSDHDWLLLVPKDSQYVRYVSDMAGYDPKQYDVSPESAVPAVMSWLATRPDAVITSTPKEVIKALPEFIERKKCLSEAWGGDEPWSNIVLLAMSIGQEHGLIPQTEEAHS